jgi:hypothetical protein
MNKITANIVPLVNHKTLLFTSADNEICKDFLEKIYKIKFTKAKLEAALIAVQRLGNHEG